MTSQLDLLLARVSELDPSLASDLKSAMPKADQYGLVFERSLPDATEIPAAKIRRGSKVRMLAPRGSTKRPSENTWTVTGTTGRGAERTATLTFENPDEVSLDLAFNRIAPLLWLKAGGRGEIIQADGAVAATNTNYGVLFNTDHARDFLTGLDQFPNLTTVFIVTDDEARFQMIASEIPEHIEVVRLYESYLRTFEIGTT